ncbi:MAG: hypothetical protein N3H84_04820 [Candidatus Caldarchaeum sp.]|nr:hypothetical protein [Candidatus Caldarchaeum sp.]
MNVLLLLLILSSLLGVVFMAVALPVVPPWLAAILLTGFGGFLVATFLALRGKKVGYWVGLVLAVLVLLVSFPDPDHQIFLRTGRILESTILIVGNILQVAYIAAFIQQTIRRKQTSAEKIT